MDKASASGAGDSRFESWVGHFVMLMNLKAATIICKNACSDYDGLARELMTCNASNSFG